MLEQLLHRTAGRPRIATLGLTVMLACIAAGGVCTASASAQLVPLPGLALGGVPDGAEPVEHGSELYSVLTGAQGSRRVLYVERWADDHWERVGGPLNDSLDGQAWHPTLLSVAGDLYVLWVEAPRDASHGVLMLAQLKVGRQGPTGWTRITAGAKAPVVDVEASYPPRLIAVGDRPAAAFTPADHSGTRLGVLMNGSFKSWRLDAVLGDAQLNTLTWSGDTLIGLQRYEVAVPAHGGSPARVETRWRLRRARLWADGMFRRTRAIEVPDATGVEHVVVQRQSDPPLLAWRRDGESVVASYDAASESVAVSVRIPDAWMDEPEGPRRGAPATFERLALTRVGGAVAVAVAAGSQLRVHRIEGAGDGARVETERASLDRSSPVHLVAGPDGPLVVGYERDGRPALFEVTFDDRATPGDTVGPPGR